MTSIIEEVKRVLGAVICRRQGTNWQFAQVLRVTVDKDNVIVVSDLVGPDRTVTPWLWNKTVENRFGSDKFDQGTWFELTPEAELWLFAAQPAPESVPAEETQLKHPALVSPMEHRRLGYKDADAQAMSPEEYTRVITGKVRKEK